MDRDRPVFSLQAWKTLNEKKVRLTTRHYETYLSGLNENGFIFDADFYLKLIDNEQIQATPRLYSLLLTQSVRVHKVRLRRQSFLSLSFIDTVEKETLIERRTFSKCSKNETLASTKISSPP